MQGNLTPGYRLNHTFHGVFLLRERARLDEKIRLIERRQVRPLVDEVLPTNQAARAHERLEPGHGRGKVVLYASVRSKALPRATRGRRPTMHN